MKVTTCGGKKMIDQPMSIVDDVVHEEMVDNKEVNTRDELTKEVVGKNMDTPKMLKLILRHPPHFSQRLNKKNEEKKFKNFISMLKKLSINLLLIDGLEQMLGYVKFIKDLVIKKRIVSQELVQDLYYCKFITTRSLVQKKEHPEHSSYLTLSESLISQRHCAI